MPLQPAGNQEPAVYRGDLWLIFYQMGFSIIPSKAQPLAPHLNAQLARLNDVIKIYVQDPAKHTPFAAPNDPALNGLLLLLNCINGIQSRIGIHIKAGGVSANDLLSCAFAAAVREDKLNFLFPIINVGGCEWIQGIFRSEVLLALHEACRLSAGPLPDQDRAQLRREVRNIAAMMLVFEPWPPHPADLQHQQLLRCHNWANSGHPDAIFKLTEHLWLTSDQGFRADAERQAGLRAAACKGHQRAVRLLEKLQGIDDGMVGSL